MNDPLRVPCLKCKKPCNLNASGICIDCKTKPCYWCGKKTRSEKKIPTCNPCSKLGTERKNASRAAWTGEANNENRQEIS
jgi:hypothetical protein